MKLDAEFRLVLERERLRLLSIDEDLARLLYPNGRWTRKEVLGHLIDSALNNHQRFVRAANQEEYRGPNYEQQTWVNMHGYREMAWADLMDHWWKQNQLLSRVVERIPENKFAVPCFIGEGEAVTLEFLVHDYLTHLRHHVDQIAV